MRKLIATTSVVGILALPVLAQTQDDGPFRMAPDATEIRASEFIGKSIYATDSDAAEENAGIGTDWEDIGEVSDVILTREGQVAAVLVDIGGFLGIGARTVAVEMDAVRLVSDSGTSNDMNDYFIVMRANRANLESAPEYDGGRLTQAGDNVAVDSNTGTDGTDAQVDTAAGGTVMAEDFARDGFVPAEPEVLTADGLAGASVYDQTDQRIGEISELLLDDTGQVQSVIVDVGGFLGVGERTVALEIQNLAFLRNEGGDEVRVYTGMTRGQLESLPAHDL